MRRLLHRLLPALVACVLMGGCASTAVVGVASPGSGEPIDVAPPDLPVTGAGTTAIDRFARNALSDLNAFWAQAYPRYFHGPFTPLAGGYFSVDPQHVPPGTFPKSGIGCAASPAMPAEVTGNAFYDPACDSIAFDRSLLQELSTDYGRLLVPVVMAHEFAHAMQNRFGYAASGHSIQDETQADCLAGSWTRWVKDGHATHVSIRTPELDEVVRGFLHLRDQVGSGATRSAHGSYFDRVSAFYEGFDKGVASCRDDFGPDRLFTDASFSTASDFADQGNAPLPDILTWVGQTLPLYWTTTFPQRHLGSFRAPTVTPFDRTGPGCRGFGGADRDLGYCPSTSTVYYDRTDLIRPAYDKIGDFAVAAGLSVPYALAARSQAGLPVTGPAATRSVVCLTGAYAHDWYAGAFHPTLEVTLSPGDIDEAVEFILAYARDDRVFPDSSTSGFELIGAFRSGFLSGTPACDLSR
jgi:predicted metalloprotease